MKATQVLRRVLQPLLIPVLALVTALAVGAIVMWIFGDPVLKAYQGLFNGAFGSPAALARTVRKISPFLLTGLSVAVAFKAGLFNIGASGQFIMGTVASVAVGINFDGLPAVIHLPLALLAGILAGALWGAIPGLLKVYTGAHEVIVTIMLNYVASNFAGWTVYAGGSQGQTPGVWRHERMPRAINIHAWSANITTRRHSISVRHAQYRHEPGTIHPAPAPAGPGVQPRAGPRPPGTWIFSAVSQNIAFCCASGRPAAESSAIWTQRNMLPGVLPTSLPQVI